MGFIKTLQLMLLSFFKTIPLIITPSATINSVLDDSEPKNTLAGQGKLNSPLLGPQRWSKDYYW